VTQVSADHSKQDAPTQGSSAPAVEESTWSVIAVALAPERLRAALVVGAMTLAALSDAAGVGLIVPLMGAVIGVEDVPGTGKAVEWVQSGLSTMFPGQGLLLPVGILIVVVYTLKTGLTVLSSYLSISFFFSAQRKWMCELLEHYMWDDYKSVQSQRRGALINNVVYETTWAGKGIKFAFLFMSQLLLVISMMVIMLVVNWQVTLILVTVAGSLAGILWAGSHRYSLGVGRDSLKLNQVISAQVEENLRAIREVKMFGLETRIVSSFRERAYKLVKMLTKFRVMVGVPVPLSELLVVMILIVVLGFVELNSPGGAARVLPLLAFFGLAAHKVFQNGSRAFSGSMSLRRFVPSLALVNQITSKTTEPAKVYSDSGGGSRNTGYESGGDIVLSDVTFSYEQDRGPVIHEVSFDIPMRSTIGILGTTGSGKSTILDLICGLYSDYEGMISIGGQDMRSINFEDWRRGVGLVGQQPVLFRGTIRDNITLGNLHGSEVDVEEAARKAQAHEFIERLPRGYDTELSDEGALSVGQKQRVAIARVIYRDPWLYLFDEATSGLDLKTEAFVQDFVATLADTKTVVIVTHRHSSVREADRVYVLEQGRVVEQGRFEDLQTIPSDIGFNSSAS